MPRLALGLLAGVLYGALSAASMLPLQFPDKRAALLGAVVGAPQVDALRLPPWVIGLAALADVRRRSSLRRRACVAGVQRVRVRHDAPQFSVLSA